MYERAYDAAQSQLDQGQLGDATRWRNRVSTQLLFAYFKRLGVELPVHSASGLPKLPAQAGYAALWNHLKDRLQGQPADDGMDPPNLEALTSTPERTLEDMAQDYDTPGMEGDVLANEGVRNLYSLVATSLTGKPRQVVFREGMGFATDMEGTIFLDPYPLGRNAPILHNAAVVLEGLQHEVGHELETPLDVWNKVKSIMKSRKPTEGLDGGRRIIKDVYNIIEDGRMERRISDLPGVAEYLAAGCALQPRWDELVGENVTRSHEVLGAILYEALPYFRVSDSVTAAMTPEGRALFEELRPIVRRGVMGSPDDAFEASLQVARRLEAAGITDTDHGLQLSIPIYLPIKGGDATSSGEQKALGDGRIVADDDQMEGTAGPGGADEPAGSASSWGLDPPEAASSGNVGGGTEEGGEGGAGNGDGTEQNGALSNGVQRTLDKLERDLTFAIGSDIRRQSRVDVLGRGLHRPLGRQRKAAQVYHGPSGDRRVASVNQPVAKEGQARTYHDTVQGREVTNDPLQYVRTKMPENQGVARQLARYLENVRDQVDATLRFQTRGRLDTHRYVPAMSGSEAVYKRRQTQTGTSFALSVALDISTSMDQSVYSGALCDGAVVLGSMCEQLNMPYELRAFAQGSFQLKSMGDSTMTTERVAHLMVKTEPYTDMAVTAGLATTSLLGCTERNRLFIALTDGELGDHVTTVKQMAKARKDGVLTFGIFLAASGEANAKRMDQLYGLGNWVTIEHVRDMPRIVGQRIALLMRRAK